MKTNGKVPDVVWVVGTGIALGVLGAVLSMAGNPPNMGFCIACFIRDIAGALGLHRAATVQYLRPEIPGIVLGAVLAALVGRELKGRSAPSVAVSFLLGALVTVGALVFLGCPLRMILRLGGGDLNALLGLAGFVAGISVGVLLLRRGYSIGRSSAAPDMPTSIPPALALGLIALVLLRPAFIFFSQKGPGSMAAPMWASLGAGLAVGFLAHRSRICFAGGIRDMLLIRSPHLLYGLAATLVAACVTNLAAGRFHPGFDGQPIAHSQHLWNFLGMSLVGLAAVLLGGCPLRQVVLASGGNGEACVAVGGMLTGAAMAHNFDLAASPAGVPIGGKAVVLGGLLVCVMIGLTLKEE
jgi:hypothetical protein